MWIGIVSLFPEMFQALQVGITGRALKNHLLELYFSNPRDFAKDKHKSVDDHPFGGGPGMVMMVEPLQAAIRAAKAAAPSNQSPIVIYLSPQGKLFNQQAALELYAKSPLIFVSGRYEGIDERVIQSEVDEEWSIGDYILTGGELPAMVMIDAMTRLIPNALHDAQSVEEDSITTGLLKYPQYTRPEVYDAMSVPNVLLSGHHEQIRRYRLQQSLGRTWLRRPDLLAQKTLTTDEKKLLAEFIDTFKQSKK